MTGTGEVTGIRPDEVPTRSWLPGRFRARNVLRVVLIVGYLGQIGVRLLLGAGQMAPHIYEDEACLLVAARWLTGGPGADFTGITFHPSGYALLLTPAYLLADDPVTIYRIVIAINALAGALAFPLAYLLLRRFDLRRKLALPIAWAAALLPAATLYGETAMADAIMPVLVLCWLLALDRFLRTGHPLAGVAASLAAGYTYLTHVRGLILLLIHAAVLLVHLARTPRKRATLLALLTAAAGLGAAAVFNGRLSAELYPGGANDIDGILQNRLLSADGQVWAISCGIGQIWAVIVGTWGLGGIGLIVTLRRLCARTTAFPERLVASALVALTLAIAYASSAAFPDWHRTGNFAYGRYLTCVAPVYCLIGIVALLRSRSRVRLALASAGLVAATGLWVFLYAGERTRTYDYQEFDFPEVSLLGSWSHLDVARTSVTVCVLLAFLVWAVRLGRPVFIGGLAAFNVIAMTVLTVVLSHPGTAPITAIPGRPDGRVAVDRQVSHLVYSAIAARVDWTHTTWFTPGRDRLGPSFCAAVVRQPRGVRPARTWPSHPADWQPRTGSVNRLTWVVWSAPRCPRT